MRKLNILLVGLGYFGEKRLKACLDLKDHFNIAGLVDLDKQRLKAISNLYHLDIATKIDSFKKKPIDLAVISTPNNTHHDLAVRSLKNGWHVLCEKPLAISTRWAKKIREASEKYQRFVKTGSNHRFFQPVEKAYDLVKKGEIGKVLSLKGSIGTNGSHTKQSWFWNKTVSGGGTFIDNGCHLLDLARMFMGDFWQCMGHTTNVFWKKADVEDLGSAIFVTKDGRQALITSSWIQWSGYLYFELWGDNGYIIVDNRHSDLVILGKLGQDQVTTFDYSSAKKDSYQRELLYLKQCILNKKLPSPSVYDGTQVIKMIESVYQSSKQKVWVKL